MTGPSDGRIRCKCPTLSKPVYLVRTRYVTLHRGILRSSFTEDMYDDFDAAKRAMLDADLKALILKRGQKLLDLRLEVSKRGHKGAKRITVRNLQSEPWRYLKAR